MSYKQKVQLREEATRTAVDRFNEVFNRHDIDALAALVTTKPFATLSALLGIAGTCLALASLSVARPALSQSSGSQGSWSTKASLLTPRAEVSVALVDGRIYVLGGAAHGRTASQLNQEYDPATDRWRERAPLPHAMTHVGAVGFNGKLYAIGGFTKDVHVGALDLVFEYDTATDTWRQLAPLSSPRGSVGVAMLDDKIHAIGGRGLDQITVSTHEVYDTSTGKWSRAAPLRTARDHMGVIVVDGKIHVIGGRTAGNADNTNLHDVYDPATNSWQSAAPLPTARSSGAAAYYHGLILYAGGECRGSGDTFSENEAYDPKTNRWLTLAALPTGRHGFGAAAIGQYAYFTGGALGCGGGRLSDQLLVFSLP
jgi:N-acetylneuraminic acid mutarotase